MRNLIEFLVKNSSWFVFVFLLTICFYFVFSDNSYQKSVFLNSSNGVVGRIYSVSGGFTSYFGLKNQNQELLEQNAELQLQIISLKEHLHNFVTDTLEIESFLNDKDKVRDEYSLIIAQVANNSVNQLHNLITINKGLSDSVKVDMGVISHQGIVGVVTAVSSNFAVVLPVLNPDTRISCKILNSNVPGTLVWDGQDRRYANLMDYPEYEKFEKGDTVITSGFSDFFPEGIKVGVVEDYKKQTNDNSYSLKVKLSTDFTSLKDVIVVGNNKGKEKSSLEKQVRNAKK